MTAPNTLGFRKLGKKNVLESVFRDSQPLPLREYVQLITRGQIDLLDDSVRDKMVTEGAWNDRKEQEQRKYVQSIFVIPESQPVIQDVLHNDPAPINDIVRKLIAHAVRNRCTILPYTHHPDGHGGSSSGGGDITIGATAVDSQQMSVLTLGYRQTRNTTQMAPIFGDADVECSHVNSVHSFLLNSKWQAIANQTGETVMRQVLSRPVFIRTVNNCYIQISGLPVNERVLSTNRVKRAQFKLTSREQRVRGLTTIPREAIMYSRRYCKRPGLPRLHILSRKSASLQEIAVEILPFLKSLQSPPTGVSESEGSGTLVADSNATTCIETSSNSEVSSHHMNLFFHVVQKIRESYRSTNVPYLLALYCTTNLQSTDEMDEECVKFNETFKSKRKRGCRGGSHVKSRKIDNFGNTNTQSTSSIINRVTRNQQLQQERERRIFLSKSVPNPKPEKLPTSSSKQLNSSLVIVAPTRAEVTNFALQASEPSLISEDSVSKFYRTSHAFTVAQMTKDRIRVRLKSRPRSRNKSSIKKHPLYPMMSHSTKLASDRCGEKGEDDSTVVDDDRHTANIVDKLPKGTNLFNLSCPIDAVSEFVKSVCRRVFTVKEIWGSRRNLCRFLASVDLYVRLGRGETLTIMQLCNKISTKDMPWIREISEMTYTNITAPSQSEVLHNFTYWIFSGFINSLLSVCFYITEGEGLGSQLLYYRKRIWSLMMKMGETQLEESFVLIPDPTHTNSKDEDVEIATRNRKPANLDDDFIPKQSIGLSKTSTTPKPLKPLVNIKFDRDSIIFKTAPFVRLVPKKRSVRPITNMTQRNKHTLTNSSSGHMTMGNIYTNKTASIDLSSSPIFKNSGLYNTLHVLRRACNSRPSLIGFGTFGLDDIYQKFKTFKCHPDIRDILSKRLNLTREDSDDEEEDKVNEKDDKNAENRGYKFYFAAIDIEKCYDNIDTLRLYDIVRNILRPSKGSNTNPSTATFPLSSAINLRNADESSPV